jgi:hypothetical protein
MCLHAEIAPKNVTASGSSRLFSNKLLENLLTFVCMAMHIESQNDGIPRNNVSVRHFVEHLNFSINSPTLGVHMHQRIEDRYSFLKILGLLSIL